MAHEHRISRAVSIYIIYVSVIDKRLKFVFFFISTKIIDTRKYKNIIDFTVLLDISLSV